MFGNQIQLLRGNHETRSINFKYGLHEECTRIYSQQQGTEIFESWNRIFNHLPYIARINMKVICMHGGIPSAFKSLTFKTLRDMKPKEANSSMFAVFNELLWNDPSRRAEIFRPSKDALFEPNINRNTGKVFNEIALKDFCKHFGVDIVVRAHEEVVDGFEVYAGGQLITLFSAVNYGKNESPAATILFKSDGEVIVHEYDPQLIQDDEKGNQELKFDEDLTVYEELDTRKPMKTAAIAAVSTVAVIGFIAGAYYLSDKISAAGTALSATQDLFAQKSAVFTRVVNGISINQQLVNGPFDEDQLMKELFPLGSNISLKHFDNSTSSKLPDDFKLLQTIIGSECTGESGCGVHKSMIAEMNKTQEMDKDFHSFKKLLIDPQTQNEAINSTSQNMTITVPTDIVRGWTTELQDLKKMMTGKTENMETFAEKVGELRPVLQNFEETSEELKKLNDFLVDLHEKVTEKAKMMSLIAKLSSVQQFKQELETSQIRYNNLVSQMTSEFMVDIKLKLKELMLMGPTTHMKKNLTVGFPNGYDDMRLVLSDHQNEWLTKLLNFGKDLKQLKLRLKPLKELVTDVEPIYTSWKEIDYESASHSLFEMNSFVDSLIIPSEIAQVLKDVHNCMSNVDLNDKFDLDLDASMKKLNETATELNTFITPISVFNKPESVQSMGALIAAIRKKGGGSYSRIKNVKTFNASISILENVHTSLKNMKLEKFEESLDFINTLEGLFGTPFHEWSEKVDFPQLVSCMGKTQFQKKIENLNPSATRLALMTPENPQVLDIDKLITSIEKPSHLVKTIKIKLPKRYRRRRATDEIILKNAKMSSKDLGDINLVVQKLISVKKHEQHLQNLINGKKTIFDIIEKVSDPIEKKSLKMLWNDNTVKSLENILKIATKLDEQIKTKKKIEIITDFKDPFNIASEVNESEVDIKQMEKALRGKVQDKLLAESLNALKTLDLKFAKYDKTKTEKALNNVQQYFDSLFGISRGVTSTSAPTETDDTYYYVGVGVALLLIAAGTFAGIFFCLKRNKKNENHASNSKSTSSKNSGGTTVDNMERGLVSTGKSSLTTGSKSTSVTQSASTVSTASSTATTSKPTHSKTTKNASKTSKRVRSYRKGVEVIPITVQGDGNFQIIKNPDGTFFIEHSSGRLGWSAKTPNPNIEVPEDRKKELPMKKIKDAFKILDETNTASRIPKTINDSTTSTTENRKINVKPWTETVLSNSYRKEEPPADMKKIDLSNWQSKLKKEVFVIGKNFDIVLPIEEPLIDATQESEVSTKVSKTAESVIPVRASGSNINTAEEFESAENADWEEKAREAERQMKELLEKTRLGSVPLKK